MASLQVAASVSTSLVAKYCWNCGSKLIHHANFCSECGVAAKTVTDSNSTTQRRRRQSESPSRASVSNTDTGLRQRKKKGGATPKNDVEADDDASSTAVMETKEEARPPSPFDDDGKQDTTMSENEPERWEMEDEEKIRQISVMDSLLGRVEHPMYRDWRVLVLRYVLILILLIVFQHLFKLYVLDPRYSATQRGSDTRKKMLREHVMRNMCPQGSKCHFTLPDKLPFEDEF